MSNFRDQLKIEGVKARGYGIMPKMVALDRKLTIEAKAIYAYFCSYAGSGDTAFPSRNKICEDLQIGVKRYYNHFKLLTDFGYIKVEKTRHENGKFKNNIYILTDKPVPVEIEEEPCGQNDRSGKNVDNNTSSPCGRFAHTDNAHTDNDYTNSNSLYNINNSLYNQSFIQDEKPSERKNERMNNNIDIEDLERILKKANIDKYHLKEKYNSAKRAIEYLYYRIKPLEINGMNIPNEQIRKDLEELNYSHIEIAFKIFNEVSANQIIRNKIAYLAVCIYNAIFDIELKIHNDLRYEGLI